MKNNIDNNSVLQHNTIITKTKITHKIGNTHNVKDCRKLEKKRNRNEKNEDATMNDDNNDNAESTVSSKSIQDNTYQDCDSDKSLFLLSKNNVPKDTSGSNLTCVHNIEVDKNVIISKCAIPTRKITQRIKRCINLVIPLLFDKRIKR